MADTPKRRSVKGKKRASAPVKQEAVEQTTASVVAPEAAEPPADQAASDVAPKAADLAVDEASAGEPESVVTEAASSDEPKKTVKKRSVKGKRRASVHKAEPAPEEASAGDEGASSDDGSSESVEVADEATKKKSIFTFLKGGKGAADESEADAEAGSDAEGAVDEGASDDFDVEEPHKPTKRKPFKGRVAEDRRPAERAPLTEGSIDTVKMAFAIVAGFVIVAAVVGLIMAWQTFFRYDDELDIQGTWRTENNTMTVVFDGEAVRMPNNLFYNYEMDTWKKTITYTFEDKTGGGRYEFSEDRNTLKIYEGDNAQGGTVLTLVRISDDTDTKPELRGQPAEAEDEQSSETTDDEAAYDEEAYDEELAESEEYAEEYTEEEYVEEDVYEEPAVEEPAEAPSEEASAPEEGQAEPEAASEPEPEKPSKSKDSYLEANGEAVESGDKELTIGGNAIQPGTGA